MSVVVVCFVCCTEKNTPTNTASSTTSNAENGGGGSSTGNASPSLNMADYVGTWTFTGDANLRSMKCVQLKADGTGTYFDGEFTYGNWSVTKDVWAEQEYVQLRMSGTKTVKNGTSTYTRTMTYKIKVLETGQNKIKASDIGFSNIFYLARTSDNAINNYTE